MTEIFAILTGLTFMAIALVAAHTGREIRLAHERALRSRRDQLALAEQEGQLEQDREFELWRWNHPAQPDRPNRTCRACGHVHPWSSPIYRCEACHRWGQDFYVIEPSRHW
jgi:hypothetical protein